jgi:hypothetical protein
LTDEAWVPAALRYKEIAALATTAAKRMRRQETEKIEILHEELPTTRTRVDEAEKRQEDIVAAAEERWRAAMESLWEERWMRVTQFPEPDPSPGSTTTDNAVRRMQSAYFELHDALRLSRSWLPLPGRRGA